jgi:hypothetical protein
VVPHLAARLVTDRAHLRELLARLGDLDLREVFVIAGDIGQSAGEFEGSARSSWPSPRRATASRRSSITGYPESHALISDETTIQAMFDKNAAGEIHRQARSALTPRSSAPGSAACATAASTSRSTSACRDRALPAPARQDVQTGDAVVRSGEVGSEAHTFNEIEAAERWRHETIARLAGRGL